MAVTIRGAPETRLVMQLVIAVAATWWLLYWFLEPIPTASAWLKSIDNRIHTNFQGVRGSVFMLQFLPIISIAFLSYFVLDLRRRLLKPTAKELTDGRQPRIQTWTLPVVIKGPFGMLTVGDLVFILVILFIVLWYFIKTAVFYIETIDHSVLEPGRPPRWVEKMGTVGVLFGTTSLIPMALLWLPVSRGSAILQVIGVPYEHAVKYHTWLGYLTVWLLLFHGGLIVGYHVNTHSVSELFVWYTDGVAEVAGIVALSAGVIMMITAVGFVRRRFFDMFFVVHHLYLVFLVFFAFHCVDKVMYLIAPVLLFLLDRFMRAVQSRKAVDVLSAKVYQSGIIELRFAKAAHSAYHALSFVYVMLPSVSRIHWHPFSVASSPLDGTNEIAIFIKPLGGFTKNLHDVLLSTQSSREMRPARDFYKCPFSLKVGLEGPYGDESSFYLRYKNVVLVAGGIGVTPFLAIIRDILHRYRLGEQDLPTSVELIFCIRNASELHMLDILAPSSILPGYESYLTIKIEAYVTSPSARAGDDTSIVASTETDPATGEETNFINIHSETIVELSVNPYEKNVRSMSTISSSGHAMWVVATMASTIVGFVIINGILNVTVMEQHPGLANYNRVFLYAATVVIAVVIFGGGMMLFWFIMGARARKFFSTSGKVKSQEYSPVHDMKKDIESSAADDIWQGNVTYGRRPSWKEFFGHLAVEHDGREVGVLVSGAKKMQEEVATECRHHSFSRESSVVMHYHSVSFEL